MSTTKIAARHLERLAVVYVRQSTLGQVRNHRESTARQYALAERAREFGWPEHRIGTIDTDLGHSAGEHAKGARTGFDELCRLLARDQVGGVFGLEISRLARNTVEWFQLLDLCRTHDVAIIEDSHVYLPSSDDDSLILGIRGTLSASELSVLRARMEGGRRNKALRGALYWRVAAGFVREGDTIRKDPDQRVQASIAAVFTAFREAGTARQAAVVLRDRDINLPVRDHSSGALLWRAASYSRTLRILKNPAMGGAYAYGLRRGRRRDTPLLAVEEQWEVLLPERHEGYVEWQEWLAIQEQLASNHSCRDGSRGPAREGPALLQGLVVCGHCGYAMAVDYNARGWSYGCNVVDPTSHQKRGCCSMGGKRLDREVVRVFLEMATPAGAEAAVRAATDVAERADADLRRWEQALEHCRYQAGLAERRYRQVDPDNRLIAATLEREWEAALVALQEAEQALAAARAEQPPPPAPEVFAELGSSLERVWGGPTTSNSDRKRLLGCLVEQVTIEHHTEAGEFAVTVHWRGGRVDDLVFPKIVTIPQPKRTDESTLDLIRNLSAHYNDRTVASILNKQGRRTAHGLPFTRDLVYNLRHRHDIPAYVAPSEQGDGVALSVADAARELVVNEATLYRWVHAGLVPVINPGVDGAPLRVSMTDALRARFRAQPPEGFVPVQVAMQRLGVSRQTIWNRARAGALASCHVTHGSKRGLYVEIADEKRFRCSTHRPQSYRHDRERWTCRPTTTRLSIVRGSLKPISHDVKGRAGKPRIPPSA